MSKIDFTAEFSNIVCDVRVLIQFLRYMLERFVPIARNFFNLKPFGITVKQEIHNLQMDLIRQVLTDYKLRGRSKFLNMAHLLS